MYRVRPGHPGTGGQEPDMRSTESALQSSGGPAAGEASADAAGTRPRRRPWRLVAVLLMLLAGLAAGTQPASAGTNYCDNGEPTVFQGGDDILVQIGSLATVGADLGTAPFGSFAV